MKRLLLILTLAVGLSAGPMSDAQQEDLVKASSYCFTKHPVIIPQAKTVVQFAIDFAISSNNMDIETFEKTVAEIGAFRKNVLKLCGSYNGDTIKDAFAITGLNLEATYELIGVIAGVGAMHGAKDWK